MTVVGRPIGHTTGMPELRITRVFACVARGFKARRALCSQVAAGDDRWLLMAVRGHLGDTGPSYVGQVLGGTVLSNDLPLFRPDISQVGVDRASVVRCR